MATRTQRKRKHQQRAHHQNQCRMDRQLTTLLEAPVVTSGEVLGHQAERLHEQYRGQDAEVFHLGGIGARLVGTTPGGVKMFESTDPALHGPPPSSKRHLPTRRGKCPECRTSQKTTVAGVMAGHGECPGKGMRPVAE